MPCELDTVVGSVSGKILYTTIFPDTGLALAFLRGRGTAQTTTRLFNMLWGVAGPALFATLFRAILTDNGPEFNDPQMIENWRPGPDNEVTLHPFLLGQKFQKLADKAILRKAGIREEKGPATGALYQNSPWKASPKPISAHHRRKQDPMDFKTSDAPRRSSKLCTKLVFTSANLRLVPQVTRFFAGVRRPCLRRRVPRSRLRSR